MNNATISSSSRPSANASQSLRPRNKHLIPGLSDDDEDVDLSGSGKSNSTRLASPRVTPLGSPGRSVSPIPSSHPSRSNSRRQAPSIAVGEGSIGIGQRDGSAPGSNNNFNTLWGTSWSALQGLANNVLGSEIPDANSKSKGKGRLRRPLELTHGKRRVASSAPPAQWGPTGQEQLDIAAGSTEERHLAVRARKRTDMLNAGAHIAPDVNGRYKRRMSDDHNMTSTGEGAVRGVEEEVGGDTLVYIIRIKPDDTLSGLAIRYDCQAQMLRRANRMWAHDSVQTRKTLVVPVAACGVKGKPVSGPLAEGIEEEDLMQFRDLTPRKEKENPIDELPNGWHPKDRQPDSQLQVSTTTAPSTTASSVGDGEPQWKHDSWVLLPNETAPTEIARLPRRALGYFPPARRKSLSYSDGGTPSVSFDLPRPPASPLAVSSFISEPTDPATKAAIDRVRGGGGTRSARSSSMASTASNTAANLAPPKWLLGPGGVGTLDRTTRTPGPAPDSLNRILGPHLPDVRPPPGTTFLPPPSFPSILDEDFESGSSAFRTGAYGRYGGGSVAMDGGAVDFAKGLSGVETWVRKMATRTYSSLSDTTARSSSRTRVKSGTAANPAVMPLAAGGGVGDLIELVDAFEVGGDDDGPDLGPEVRVDEPVEVSSWRNAAGSARPDAPAGMSKRVGRSSERSKSGKDD